MNTALRDIAQTLLHSLWQSALLACMAIFVLQFQKTAQQRKQILFHVVMVQFAVSFFTFLILQHGQSFLQFSIQTKHSMDWLEYFSLTYGAILLVKSGLLVFRLRQIRYLKHLNIKPSVDIKLFSEKAAWQMGISRKVRVFYCNYIHSPITLGFLKPLIILPISLVNRISMAETEAIIVHELAHIQQRDYLFHIILLVIEHIFFFNPFVLLLATKYKQEREFVADEIVLHFNIDPLLYSQALFTAAKTQYSHNLFALNLLGKHSNVLLQRIQHINRFKPQLTVRKNVFPKLLFIVLSSLLLSITFKHETIKSPIIQDQTKSQASPALLPNSTTLALQSPSTEVATMLNKPTKPGIFPKKKIQIISTPTKKIDNRTEIDRSNGIELTPVSFNEHNANEQPNKLIIEQEESNVNGKKLTIYNVTYANGIYTLTPQVGITRKDSVLTIKDTLRGVEQ